MKLNTNSNTYTVLYAAGVVVVVAFLLAFAYTALKSRSDANERIDKKQQILAALNVREDKAVAEDNYAKYVEQAIIVNAQGEVVDTTGGFEVANKEINAERLPLYVCKTADGERKYVVPMVGKGLWGSIWGFVALNADCKTVYGAYFSHESETAGLGALIKEQKFQDEFKGKQAYSAAGDSVRLAVVKAGTVKQPESECDGITGATLTGNGVNAMIQEYLGYYQAYLMNVEKTEPSL